MIIFTFGPRQAFELDDAGLADHTRGDYKRRSLVLSKRAVHLLIMSAGISLFALLLVPLDTMSLTDLELTGVAILKPGINHFIWYLGGSCMLVLLVVSTVCWKNGLRLHFGVCLATGGLVFPAAAAYRITDSLAPWIVCSTCIGPDGKTLAFMDSSFLQGQTIALGREDGDGWLYKNSDILGDTNGDSPRSYALIVRPTDKVRTTYGQLHLSSGGLLLGIRHNNRCYFAYDFSSRRFVGYGDVEELSPFLLVDVVSRLYDTDVQTLFRSTDVQFVGLPTRQVLLDAMSHQNHEVRQLARLLLEHHSSE